MGASGGSKAQKRAQQDPLTREDGDVQSVKTGCDTTLEVIVKRADTREAVEGIEAKAGKKKLTLKGTTAEETGLVEWKDIKTGTYVVELVLSEEQLKQFARPGTRKVKVRKKTKTTVTFMLRPIVEMRIVLTGFDSGKKGDSALDKRAWALLSPDAVDGTTGEDGSITVRVPFSADRARLDVTLEDPPGPTPPDPQVVANATDYPPKIKPEDFTEEKIKRDRVVNWALELCDLEESEEDKPIIDRLRNLGFGVGDGKDPKKVEKAVKAYQALYEDEADGSGAVADVRDAVEARHDLA